MPRFSESVAIAIKDQRSKIKDADRVARLVHPCALDRWINYANVNETVTSPHLIGVLGEGVSMSRASVNHFIEN